MPKAKQVDITPHTNNSIVAASSVDPVFAAIDAHARATDEIWALHKDCGPRERGSSAVRSHRQGLFRDRGGLDRHGADDAGRSAGAGSASSAGSP